MKLLTDDHNIHYIELYGKAWESKGYFYTNYVRFDNFTIYLKDSGVHGFYAVAVPHTGKGDEDIYNGFVYADFLNAIQSYINNKMKDERRLPSVGTNTPMPKGKPPRNTPEHQSVFSKGISSGLELAANMLRQMHPEITIEQAADVIEAVNGMNIDDIDVK